MPANAKDLCTLADVTALLPGYKGNTETDAFLQRSITSESDLIPGEAGREIIGPQDGDGTESNPYTPSLKARTFPIADAYYALGRIEIGDLSSLNDDTTVEVLNAAGTSILTVEHSQIVPLHGVPPAREYATDTWEPITALRFRPGTRLGYRTTLRVTGVWGFPEIPAFIREACAKRAVLRYVSDVASEGTQLADSVDNINLAAMFASARDAIDLLRGGPIMIR